jgi:hypothetical protein
MILDSIRGPLFILPVISGKQIAQGAQPPLGFGLAGRMNERDLYVFAPWPLNHIIQKLQ